VGLANAQRRSINELWHKCIADTDGPGEPGKPRRDIDWFVTVFCKGVPPEGRPDDIFPHLQAVGGSYVLYDAVNLIAAIPTLASRFFDPAIHEVRGVDHEVIGVSAKRNGVDDPAGLYDLMTASLVGVLIKPIPAVRAHRSA
jgi:hypothetical protein